MTAPTLIDVLRDLQTTIRRLRKDGGRPALEGTFQALIMPVLIVLGWDLADEDEVSQFYQHTPSNAPVDIALSVGRSPAVFLEVEPMNECIDGLGPFLPTLHHATKAGVEWCVLTNGDEWRIYNRKDRMRAREEPFLVLRIDDDEALEAKAWQFLILSRHSVDTGVLREAYICQAIKWGCQEASRDEALIERMVQGDPKATPAIVRTAIELKGLLMPSIEEFMRDEAFPTGADPTTPAVVRNMALLPSNAQASAAAQMSKRLMYEARMNKFFQDNDLALPA